MLMSPPSLLLRAARRRGAWSGRSGGPAHLGRSTGRDLLHHLLHLTVLLQQLIALLHARSRAGRDPAAARAVDHLRVATLRRRHRQDHRLDAVSYTHLRAHETDSYLVCRLLLE